MSVFAVGQTVEVRHKMDVDPHPMPPGQSFHVWRPGIIVFIGDNPDTGEWELIVECKYTFDPRLGDRLTVQSVWGDTDTCHHSFSKNQLEEVRVPARTIEVVD